MSRAEDRKNELVKRLIHDGVQYANASRKKYTHGLHEFYSKGEDDLATILDGMHIEYDTHVPFEHLFDGDRYFDFRPDFVTHRDIKIPGCSYNITVLEYFGGEFLIHDDIRKMQALRSATGRRGHIILPGHLHMLQQEGAQWHKKDFDDFRSPGCKDNLDEVSMLIMMDVLRDAGIEFYTNPEFTNCIAPNNDRRFTARGHLFLPQPTKFIGIDEPIQYIRCVRQLRKSEIISLEGLHAAHNINGYALLRELVLMYRRQGLSKRRPQVPNKFDQHYTPHNGDGKLRDQPIKRKPNGGHH